MPRGSLSLSLFSFPLATVPMARGRPRGRPCIPTCPLHDVLHLRAALKRRSIQMADLPQRPSWSLPYTLLCATRPVALGSVLHDEAVDNVRGKAVHCQLEAIHLGRLGRAPAAE